jgi:hypothetical protein
MRGVSGASFAPSTRVPWSQGNWSSSPRKSAESAGTSDTSSPSLGVRFFGAMSCRRLGGLFLEGAGRRGRVAERPVEDRNNPWNPARRITTPIPMAMHAGSSRKKVDTRAQGSSCLLAPLRVQEELLMLVTAERDPITPFSPSSARTGLTQGAYGRRAALAVHKSREAA